MSASFGTDLGTPCENMIELSLISFNSSTKIAPFCFKFSTTCLLCISCLTYTGDPNFFKVFLQFQSPVYANAKMLVIFLFGNDKFLSMLFFYPDF